MKALFTYPKSAALKRVVPKSRIYAQTDATTALKDRFVREVEQITWAYKLAPETINLPATKSVTEVQIFHVILKADTASDEVLRAIDRAIPFPVLFELLHGDHIQVAAAHKRPSEADSAKWVVSGHLRSDWVPQSTKRNPLPVAINMASLYEQMLTALMPIQVDPDEDIAARLERVEALRAAEREIARLKSKLQRETQFNIKVGLHSQLQEAQAAFEHMKKPEKPGGER
jgi:hypothetical protein